MAETTDVLMPLMGEGITEATLIKWLKKPGDQVAKDEPLLEVSTDKVETEIPAPADGYLLKTFADQGSTVEINSILAQIGATPDTELKEAAPEATKEQKPAPQPQASQKPSSAPAGPSQDRRPASGQDERSASSRSSPLVRKMAREKNVDLSQVPGSGLHGRITKRDLQAVISPRRAAWLPASAAKRKPSKGCQFAGLPCPGSASLQRIT